MDCSPLNLAHFHERRAEKFLKFHRYNDAHKAVETSLLYIQDAYKNIKFSKSIEVLDTQQWEYERKLRQIQIRKQQHDRFKLKEIVPSHTDGTAIARIEANQTAQSVAKSIDKTVQDFDAKFNLKFCQGKEILEPKSGFDIESSNDQSSDNLPIINGDVKYLDNHIKFDTDNDSDMPSLAPLELPTFDTFDFDFSSSTPTLANIASLVESFQK